LCNLIVCGRHLCKYLSTSIEEHVKMILKGEVDYIMRFNLIHVYRKVSVESSIGWLKIRIARMRAHARMLSVSLVGA
jgi:hypothetical protein